MAGGCGFIGSNFIIRLLREHRDARVINLDALTYAGLRVGLPRGLSKLAAAQSVLGTAKMIVDGVMTPSEIEEMVTTPGGTTIEGIYEIEDGKLRTALMNAVQAATNKCINIRHIWDKAA